MATTVSLKPNAIEISGSTSGTTTLQATAVAGTTTLTLPAATDTLVGKATTDTLTNKTLGAVTLGGTVAGGGNQINNVIIGTTNPLAGSFTTLSATGTISGTGTNTWNIQSVGTSGSLVAGGWFYGVNEGLNLSPNGAGLLKRLTISYFNGATYAEALGISNVNTGTGTLSLMNGVASVTSTGLAVTGLTDISAATSGQIKFPATQNASTNANTLDDYEEGTWTPLYTSFTFGGTTTTTNANYVKIGKCVYVTFSVADSVSIACTTGISYIDGLPFAVGGSSTSTSTNENTGASVGVGLVYQPNSRVFLPTFTTTAGQRITTSFYYFV